MGQRTQHRRVAAGLWALLPLTCLLGAWATAGDGEPKPSPPPREPSGAEMARLLRQPVETPDALTKDPKTFREKARRIQTGAYSLAVYAQAAMAGRDEPVARRLAGLWDDAMAVADASIKGDHPAARERVGMLGAGRGPAPGQPEARAEVPFGGLIPGANLMEQIGLLRAEVGRHEEMDPETWQAEGVRDERLRACWKLAALARAVGARAPEMGHAVRARRTRQLWLDSSKETAEASRLLRGTAAGGREAFAAALKRVDAACQKCHDVFRAE